MNLIARLPPTSTRVEHETAQSLNRAIRDRTEARVALLEHAGPQAIDERLADLDREWDIERVLQTNASVIVLLGLLLAMRVDRRFLLLPAAVFSFFAQHALQGWCPPIPLFRRLGIRTVREIERERHTLKVLRGDFDGIPGAGAAPPVERVRAVLAAIDA
jgi:hypothetical protein